MEGITYSLKPDQKNSKEYYSDVVAFTDEVLLRASDTITPIVKEHMDFIRTYNLEEIREIEEYILELISFGVLWRTYAARALNVRYAPFVTLSKMAIWRKKNQKLKPYIDFLRGIFITSFLYPKNIKYECLPPTLEQVDHVCKWFEATGEFREQALRFVLWRAFWGTKTSEEILNIFYTIEQFTNWFNEQSITALGKYTLNVENFLHSSTDRYKWREDRVSSTRSRIEYHLNMAGAELMNRAFKMEFNNTDIKVVLLPGCMRSRKENECKAVRVKEGLICTGCLQGCHVNQLRELGKKQNFDVYIIPHASDLSLWSPTAGRPKRGVLASACVTTLVEGGWELKRYNVPAQCVLLDYSGCKKHWHCQGIPTELNVHELKRILQKEGSN